MSCAKQTCLIVIEHMCNHLNQFNPRITEYGLTVVPAPVLLLTLVKMTRLGHLGRDLIILNMPRLG